MRHLKLFEEFEFPSQFAIGDEVSFRPMARHCEEMAINPNWGLGTVVAVRFTEAKVFYDVLCDYYGKVFDNVDSAYVRPEGEAPEEDEETGEPEGDA